MGRGFLLFAPEGLNLNLTSAAALKAYLLFREVVFDQTAHNLLRGPGCADMRGD